MVGTTWVDLKRYRLRSYKLRRAGMVGTVWADLQCYRLRSCKLRRAGENSAVLITLKG